MFLHFNQFNSNSFLEINGFCKRSSPFHFSKFVHQSERSKLSAKINGVFKNVYIEKSKCLIASRYFPHVSLRAHSRVSLGIWRISFIRSIGTRCNQRFIADYHRDELSIYEARRLERRLPSFECKDWCNDNFNTFPICRFLLISFRLKGTVA